MGYLICSKCKSYYLLESGESAKDFIKICKCGNNLRYVENLDIIDPNWKKVHFKKKITKREIIRKKIQSMRSTLFLNLKTPLLDFWNKFRYRIQSAKNWNQNNNQYNTHYDMGINPLFAIKNELNFNNVRWTYIIPVIVAITLILTFAQGIFTLFTFIILLAVGYLFHNPIIGTKNAIIAGAISFFLASLFAGSFLLIIPYTLLGAVNGGVCGLIGGYLKKIRSPR